MHKINPDDLIRFENGKMIVNGKKLLDKITKVRIISDVDVDVCHSYFKVSFLDENLVTKEIEFKAKLKGLDDYWEHDQYAFCEKADSND